MHIVIFQKIKGEKVMLKTSREGERLCLHMVDQN